MALEFAVFDVETTGFFPEKDDRLVEVAVLRLDSKGKILRQFHSVVNPERSLPQARTHRLREEDLTGAPVFADIAANLVDLFSGSVFISHNVVFNLLFLKEEFKRLGHTLPRSPSICTLELARRLVPEPKSRRLPDVCKELGLTYGQRSALEEAKATRLVFLQALRRLSEIRSIQDLGITDPPPDKNDWPVIRTSGLASEANDTALSKAPPPSPSEPKEESPIQDLMHRAEACSQETPALDQYLILLDLILEDRIITDDEKMALEKLAEDHQLWKSEIEQAHQTYMKELFVAAWRDGKITAGERKDLEAVRKLLSLPMHEYSELMEQAKKEAKSSPDPASFMVSLEKIRGMSICFSGPPQCKIRGTVPSEMFAQSLAIEAGLKTQTSLSGALDFLVVPDRDHSSFDLEQTQELGIRILAEPVFWRMIGVDIG